ncbi:MAG: hypothetical protein ACK41O_22400 [Runella zeae]
MKAKILLTLSIILLGIASCKKIETENTPTPTAPTLAKQAKEYADAHPAIQPPALVNYQPTSVKVSIGSFSVGTYHFQYDYQKRLADISTDKSSVFNTYLDPTNSKATSKWTTREIQYQLNPQGLAQSSEGVFMNGKEAAVEYFYKNGYLVSSADKNYLTKLTYKTNGDLQEWNGLSHLGETIRALYTYTTFPNTIQQEINYWAAPHFALRGDFLGKYSSHLVEKVVFTNRAGDSTLDFSYTFDSQNRVTKVVIKRNLSDDAIYEYSY